MHHQSAMKGPVHKWVCRDRAKGPSAPTHSGASASVAETKDDSGQKLYKESRELD